MNLKEIVAAALHEDSPSGDVTTEAMGFGELEARAQLKAKEDLVLSGTEPFEIAMHWTDEKIRVQWLKKDGDFVYRDQTVASLAGPATSLLKAERVALNFLGQLSGIATLTRCFTQKVAGTSCQILDTRKTTPLHRGLEKSAVRHGGGTNHRSNLSDAILIKDNHIAAAGSIREAILRCRKNSPLPIEVECGSLDDVKVAVELKVEKILLDNMSTETIRSARTLIPPGIRIEASGNMSLDRVREVADCGVDEISVGALTHSAPCADLSLEFSFARQTK